MMANTFKVMIGDKVYRVYVQKIEGTDDDFVDVSKRKWLIAYDLNENQYCYIRSSMIQEFRKIRDQEQSESFVNMLRRG